MSNTITLGPKAKNRLERIKERRPNNADAEIAFTALDFLDQALEHVANGGKVVFEYRNGTADNIIIKP